MLSFGIIPCRSLLHSCGFRAAVKWSRRGFASQAEPAEDRSVTLARVIAASPDKVWAEMRDFLRQTRHIPSLASAVVTHTNPEAAATDAVGCVRSIIIPQGLEAPLRERLLEHSDAERRFTLTVEAPNPFRLDDYRATVTNTPLTDGSTLTQYLGTFRGPPETVDMVTTTYTQFLASVAIAAELPEVEVVRVRGERAGGLSSGKLAGRVALVTGGASGIGKAIAEALANQGARIVIADKDEAAACSLAASLPDGSYAAVDLRHYGGVQRLVAAVANSFGRLDIVVNNAGISGESIQTGDHPVSNWHTVLDINLNGAFYVLREALSQMSSQSPRGGVILNIASTAALAGVPGVPAYTAGKAGLVALTRSSALEYAHDGIRVVAIAPTVVETELVANFMADNPQVAQAMMYMNPMPGLPTPAEVAPAAVFLCSDDAKWVSGSVLPVDGAYCAGQKVSPDPLF